jgi:hypothetical protein
MTTFKVTSLNAEWMNDWFTPTPIQLTSERSSPVMANKTAPTPPPPDWPTSSARLTLTCSRSRRHPAVPPSWPCSWTATQRRGKQAL